MPVPEPTTRQKNPIEHLRDFVSSVLEPQKKKQDPEPEQADGAEARKPFRGRNVADGNSEDRTIKFLFAGTGAVVVIVLMVMGLSHKHVTKKAPANAPPIGQPPSSSQPSPTQPNNSNIVPHIAMQPAPAQREHAGKLTARDLENADTASSSAVPQTKAIPSSPPATLGQVAPFNAGQTGNDNWSPKPYAGQTEPASATQLKAERAGLAKPSLVFVATPKAETSSREAANPLQPTLNLGPGTRLVARLNAITTTAVDLPVNADIEYSYQRDGEIIVPAGSTAVGHIQQADRSGYMLIKFDRIEIPHRGEVPIDAVATNRNLGPLKGKVTGTHTGRNFLVRSFTDVGSGLAMFAGQNNTSGAISENDLLRAQLAQNVGNAGDQEIMQLMLTEHPIVTLPAHTDIFVVFEKTDAKATNANRGTLSSGLPQTSLTQLRQLLELQRELNQSQPVAPNAQQ